MGHPRGDGGASPLGELIAHERQRRGLTRRELAALVRRADRTLRTDAKTVERWELRGQVPVQAALRALAAVLGRPVAELTALRAGSGIMQPEDDTERRTFVGLLLAAGAGLDPELLAAAVGAPATADRRLLDDLEALTGEYGRLYWSLRPAALWPTVVAHVAVTRRLHDTARPAQRQQAGRIASEAATLLGMLAHRIDRHLDSSMYLHLAAELAALADDGPRRAHALVALRAAYAPVTGAGLRTDPQRALQLTNEAVEVAGNAAPPLLRTWLHACRAEDHATLGQATAAEQELVAAEAALAQAPGTAGGFFGHWDGPRLAGFRGSSALLLKHPAAAIEVLEVVAGQTSPDLIAPHTAVRTDLAAGYALQGDVDHACGILQDVLELATSAGMPDRAGRVRRTRDRYLAGWADAAPVRQLDDHLRLFAEAP